MQVVCNCIAIAMQMPICIIVVYSSYRSIIKSKLLYIKRARTFRHKVGGRCCRMVQRVYLGPRNKHNTTMSDTKDKREFCAGPDASHYAYMSKATQPDMTMRDYACIRLRVPDSEHEWLNDIIRKAQRDEFAAKAMGYYLSTVQEDELSIDGAWTPIAKSDAAHHAYLMADSMLKAREQ